MCSLEKQRAPRERSSHSTVRPENATAPPNFSHAVHEIFLLAIIGFIAFALIAAANGAYTADACAVHEHTSEPEPAHKTTFIPQQRADRPGLGA